MTTHAAQREGTKSTAGTVGNPATTEVARPEQGQRARPAATHPGAHTAGPVVVPLDGSDVAERALPWAIHVAWQRRATLLLLRVVMPNVTAVAELPGAAGAPRYDVLLTAEQTEAEQYLEEKAAAIRSTAPRLGIQTAVQFGDPAAHILDTAATQQAQLVVLTTHGRTGLTRWVRGSVAEKLLRYGSTPILLIRPWDLPVAAPTEIMAATEQPRRPAGAGAPLGRRVLAPLDGSLLAEQVLPEAIRLTTGTVEGSGSEAPLDGQEREGEIVLVMVTGIEQQPASRGTEQVDDVTRSRDAARTYLHDVARDLRRQDVIVRTVVLTAKDTARAIVEHATTDGADVIAMSTHGRGGVGRLLYGSVADRVAHEAPVPVLLFHPRAGEQARTRSDQ